MQLSVRVYHLNTRPEQARPRRARLLIVVDEVDAPALAYPQPIHSKISRPMKENENPETDERIPVGDDLESTGPKEAATQAEEPTTRRSWLKVVKMILEFALAALTALGVTSCISFLNR